MVVAADRPFLPEQVREGLADLLTRLEQNTAAALADNAGPIRGRFVEIAALLPEDLMTALNPVAYMEFHRVGVMQAHRRIAARAARDAHKTRILEAENRSQAEHDKLLELQAKPQEIQSELDRLKQELADLLAAVEAKRQEIRDREAAFAIATEATTQQEGVWRSAMDQVQAIYEVPPPADVPGSDEEDNVFLAELELIRLTAINSIRRYL